MARKGCEYCTKGKYLVDEGSWLEPREARILDDCEIALGALEKSTDSDAAKEGTRMIFDKLSAYLKGKGLERIEAKGKDFDTELHEAVTTFPAPSEDLKGKVIDVVQTGYTLSGKVLRYAKVVVGA